MWVFPSSSGVGTARFSLDLLCVPCKEYSFCLRPVVFSLLLNDLLPVTLELLLYGRGMEGSLKGYQDYPQISGASRIASYEVMTCCL